LQYLADVRVLVYKTAEDVAVGKFQPARLGLLLKDGELAATAQERVAAKDNIVAAELVSMLREH
jgi:hypothetical protein